MVKCNGFIDKLDNYVDERIFLGAIYIAARNFMMEIDGDNIFRGNLRYKIEREYGAGNESLGNQILDEIRLYEANKKRIVIRNKRDESPGVVQYVEDELGERIMRILRMAGKQ